MWTRDGSRAYRMGRAIQAGRVWTTCDHAHPAHAALGGYQESGIGRETHKAMLDHDQQTKILRVRYAPNALGCFCGEAPFGGRGDGMENPCVVPAGTARIATKMVGRHDRWAVKTPRKPSSVLETTS